MRGDFFCDAQVLPLTVELHPCSEHRGQLQLRLLQGLQRGGRVNDSGDGMLGSQRCGISEFGQLEGRATPPARVKDKLTVKFAVYECPLPFAYG